VQQLLIDIVEEPEGKVGGPLALGLEVGWGCGAGDL